MSEHMSAVSMCTVCGASAAFAEGVAGGDAIRFCSFDLQAWLTSPECTESPPCGPLGMKERLAAFVERARADRAAEDERCHRTRTGRLHRAPSLAMAGDRLLDAERALFSAYVVLTMVTADDASGVQRALEGMRERLERAARLVADGELAVAYAALEGR